MIPISLRCWSALGLALCLLQVAPVLSAAPAAPTAPAPAATQTTVSVGTIVARRVTGRVEAKDKPSKVLRQLANESKVSQADVVSTADDGHSSVVLVFSTGTTVHLRHGSVFDVEEFQQEPWTGKAELSKLEAEPSSSHTRLNLVKGELLGKATKLKKDGSSTLQVRTPVGVAGIRGTTFRIVFRPDPQHPGQYLFQLSTAEGRVEFQPFAPGSQPVIVEGNREISATVQVRIDPATGIVVPVSAPLFQTGTQPISSQTLQQVQTMVIEVLQAIQGVIINSSSNDRGAGQQGGQGEQGKSGEQPLQNGGSQSGQDTQQVRFSTDTQDSTPAAPAASSDATSTPSLPPLEPATPPRVTSGEGR
jgi:hypothetical protein